MSQLMIGILIYMLFSFTVIANAAEVAAGKIKAIQCIACHGLDGNSPLPQYPKLAGQHVEYLFQAMKAYQTGTRVDPIMSPMAEKLLGTDSDIENLAAYFSSQKSTACSKPLEIHSAGKAKVKSKACDQCHQLNGNSQKPIFPKLAGQHKMYLIKSMTAYRDGTRKHAQMSQMALLLRHQADIEEIAAYFAAQKSDRCE
jgi:cytochrome c553